jgi:anti-anti-sigma factor
VHIEGDMDTSVVPDVRSAIDRALDSGCTSVVLDLSAVTYADSSALALIVWLDRRLRPTGGRLVLAGANRNVNRVLELSGLIGVAPSIMVASDAEQALSRLDLPPVEDEPLWEHRLAVRASVDEMSRVRTDVCALVEPLGLGEAAVFDLKVAVGEALANAVRHGSPAGDSDEVEVTVSAYRDRVVVAVKDTGSGFDGVSPAGDDVYASGGRGIMFMRALTDLVEFDERAEGGTVVRLTKRLPSARPAARLDPASA